LSQFKKYHPSGNLKFYNLGILKRLKLRILVNKMLLISHKLNFTPNTLGCKGLNGPKKASVRGREVGGKRVQFIFDFMTR